MKTGFSHVSLHEHNSGTKSARELFKLSKDSGSLRVTNEKKIVLVSDFEFFVSDIISGVLLGLSG